MIVDAHMHLWRRIRGLVAGREPVRPLRDGRIRIGKRELLGMPTSFHDCRASAERALAEMDAAGVDCGVVVQEYLDGAQNAYLLEVARRHPGRFFLHGLPDFFRPARAARECAELLDAGFRGLKWSGAHLLGRARLDDPRLDPVWERMAAEELVLAADLAPGAAQAAELEAVLARFPRLRVAVGHLGMVTRGDWLAQIRLARHEQVCVECGGVVWLFRHEGWPFPGARAAIREAAGLVGIEKLMWGSDWPRAMVDFTYRQALGFAAAEEGFLPASQRRLFLGGNAARLYRLAEPAAPRRPLPLITEG